MAVKLKQFLNAFSEQGQKVENVLQELYNLRSIDSAFGAQLDGIGEIAGESRLGRNDEKYRIAIKFRFYLDVSSGEPETLIRATEFLTQASVVQYYEVYPATVQLFTDGTSIDINTKSFIQSLAPAGVRVSITQISGLIGFRFSEDGQPDPVYGGSFSEAIDDTNLYLVGGVPVGGRFVEDLI